HGYRCAFGGLGCAAGGARGHPSGGAGGGGGGGVARGGAGGGGGARGGGGPHAGRGGSSRGRGAGGWRGGAGSARPRRGGGGRGGDRVAVEELVATCRRNLAALADRVGPFQGPRALRDGTGGIAPRGLVAQPPATGCQAFGLKEDAGGNERDVRWAGVES